LLRKWINRITWMRGVYSPLSPLPGEEQTTSARCEFPILDSRLTLGFWPLG